MNQSLLSEETEERTAPFTLSPHAIVVFTARTVFAREGKWRGEALYGRLDNGRPVSISTSNDRGLITVRVTVPGGGNLGFSYQIFADEATLERVKRLVRHFFTLQCQRAAEWDMEKAAEAI